MLTPEWPVPERVIAAVSTRQGGVSEGPYHSLNTATHVGDDPVHVGENRRLLAKYLQLPSAPVWLNQVHGVAVVEADQTAIGAGADGAVTSRPGVVCAVQTADCLPVFFTNAAGDRVAVAHAGWAGLMAGVLENTVAKFAVGDRVLAWLGPCISQPHFEVGPEVREGFLKVSDSGVLAQTQAAFVPGQRTGHWMADLYQLARLRLEPLGVNVSGGGLCTFADEARFFSYRRDKVCGRMVSLIYIKP